VQLKTGRSQATGSSNIEEMFENVKHARARPGPEMSKRTDSRDATPPRTRGVPNEHGYQEDQPRDVASATCCALLRPLPQERQPSPNPRPGARDATDQGFAKR
jgi:hypothetical protein